MNIPFNKPHMTGKELWYIAQAHHDGQLAGMVHLPRNVTRGWRSERPRRRRS